MQLLEIESGLIQTQMAQKLILHLLRAHQVSIDVSYGVKNFSWFFFVLISRSIRCDTTIKQPHTSAYQASDFTTKNIGLTRVLEH